MTIVDTRPPPLVPADCDLRAFAGTMIMRARLFGSSFHANANDAEWRAGMTLWLKSWDEMPSGTLPIDEVHQCKLAELGRDLRTWRKLKAVALRGWIECQDGRLHHRVVAEVALTAWLEKLGQQLSGGSGNAKRWDLQFDPAPLIEQIECTQRMLFAINPQSRALRKRRLSGIPAGIPTGSKNYPNGNAYGSPDRSPDRNPGGNPVGIASEVNGNQLLKSASGVKTPTVPSDSQASEVKNAKNAIENNESQPRKPKGGQKWDEPAWVNATALTVGKTHAPGEPFPEFRDRVYGALQAKLAEAKRATK